MKRTVCFGRSKRVGAVQPEMLFGVPEAEGAQRAVLFLGRSRLPLLPELSEQSVPPSPFAWGCLQQDRGDRRQPGVRAEFLSSVVRELCIIDTSTLVMERGTGAGWHSDVDGW